MKKRILALALAGTTAFSVFGAAISANAAYVWNGNGWTWEDDSSTHVAFENDEYVQYSPVATKIEATYAGKQETSDYVYLDKNVPAYIVFDKDKTNDSTGVETAEDGTTYNVKYYKDQAAYMLTVLTKDDFSDKELYNFGSYYVSADGYVLDTKGDAQVYGTYNDDYLTEAEIAADSNLLTALHISKATNTAHWNVTPKNSGDPTIDCASLKEAITKSVEQYKADAKSVGHWVRQDSVTLTANPITATAYNALPTESEYLNNVEAVKLNTTVINAGGTVKVNGISAYVTVGNESKNVWHFDASTSVSDTPISLTEVVTYGTNAGTIETTSVYVPTIFAYDYVYANQFQSTASAIANIWNNENKTETDVAAAVAPNGTATLVAERGSGATTYGVRASVISDWVNFLDELGINHDNGYSETREEFLENYEDLYDGVAVYDPNTGKLIGYNKVDLYNLDQLLKDIYELSAKNSGRSKDGIDIRGYYNANTSEMVYLMQQYDKYFNDYVQKEEVATGEWGEFLLEILNSATADDFAKSVDYTRYVNRVENLEAAYESATTVNMIREAEEGMYALLTELNGSYKAAATPSKTDLAATMESLYFNIKTPGLTYTTAPSTQSANVDYKTYNYYVAVAEKQNTGNEWTFTSTLAPGYYSLYPMVDYQDNDVTTPNKAYNGNVGASDFTGAYSTEEYEWFWNVYQLAYNMNKSNTKQGSIDAIDAALNEAVAALAPTTSPYATETTAMEEMMDEYTGKIDTDYNEGFYDKYEQAYDYAENSAEGKYQTRIARYIVGVAGEALTYQGTQLTVTKQMITGLEASIKEGKTALEAIKADANYNAAQVNALNKALANAQNIIDLYNGTAFNKFYGDQRDGQSVNHVYTSKVGDKDQYVISDVENAMADIDAAINYSEIVMGWSKNEAGKWMYGTEEGYLTNGWNKIGSTWFYFNEDGTAKQSEWLNENGTWYWFNSNCGAATGWAKVDGEWYFFKGNNAMKTGWEKVDGNWYYMASSGKMVTGWCEIGGKWYYFSKESNSLGQMLYSTTVDGYKLDANGVWVK